jgi:RecJ-like exonuclease
MRKKEKKTIKERNSLVECAFCQGTGLDPFEVPSKLSQCQTCKGRGKVHVPEPSEECPSCLGRGVYLHHRLTCSVCGGKGRIKKRNKLCAEKSERRREEAIDIETGLPSISAYEMQKPRKKRQRCFSQKLIRLRRKI